MTCQRWIRVCVDLLDHPVVTGGEFDRRSAWLWLIARAAWKAHDIRTRGGMVRVERGQVIASLQHLADTWGWSVKRVRTFLAELAAAEMIEKRHAKNQYAATLTICNYDKYQTPSETENADGAREGKRVGEFADEYGIEKRHAKNDCQKQLTLCNYDKYQTPSETENADGAREGHAKGTRRAREGQHSTKDTRDIYYNTPPTPPAGGPSASDALEAFHLYNATAERCGLPQASKLTPDRKRKLIARLKDFGLEGWRRALANLERSSFLTGGTDAGFRADLDFVLQAKSFARLHDGGYGNGRHVAARPAVGPRREWSPDDPETQAWIARYCQ
jgi:hypothetical protein